MVSRRKREEQNAEEVLQTRKAKEKILGETVSINYFQIPSSIKMALKQILFEQYCDLATVLFEDHEAEACAQ